LATNASFVIWTCSGLENALFAALITYLLYLALACDPGTKRPNKLAVIAGIVAGAVALTRPDGLVYTAVFPFTIALKSYPVTKETVAKLLKSLITYSLSFLAVFGSYLIFRILYFGEFFPNTYYAKGGPTLSVVKDALTLQPFYLSKIQEIFQSIFGPKLWIVIPIAVMLWLVSIVRNRISIWKDLVVLLAFFLAGFTYLILINDWMGEYRLATPFFVLVYIFMGMSLSKVRFLNLNLNKYHKIAAGAAVIALSVVTFSHHYYRLSKFYSEMPVSFAGVAERFGHTFNNYADSLGIENGSFLVPDIGGALYYSKLRIYDLGGLCDPVIARTLVKDRPRFLEYVFEEIKPTFIHTHGWFTTTARFHEDFRFERDYLPLYQYEDKYASERLKKKIMSGHYVRKEFAVPEPHF
jgi:hypothetical protein